jgi:hypothetical protein
MKTQINSDLGNYEIHEWGVLAGCQKEDKYFCTARPLVAVDVEPIIYVHSRDKKAFSLRVIFRDGKPTDTYPPAEVHGNSLSWTNVQFSPKGGPSSGLRQEEYEPLKDIIGRLSDVDADELQYGKLATRFLFYEGEMHYDNKIRVEHNLTGKRATVNNTGKATVYDVLVVVPQGKGGLPFTIDVFYTRIAKLAGGESVTTELLPWKEDFSFVPQLMGQGFTRKEATSFDGLWEKPFFQPLNKTGWSNLIYRLSEEACENVTELSFTPKPKKCVRALYVLVRSVA